MAISVTREIIDHYAEENIRQNIVHQNGRSKSSLICQNQNGISKSSLISQNPYDL